MGARHRARTSRSNLVVGSIAASVGVSSVLAAAIVELVAPDAPVAATPSAPQVSAPPQQVTQQGRVVAVSPESLTTQGPDGTLQTFAVTPNTAAITGSGQSTTFAASFTVNDEVMVVGTTQGGSAIATAVADTSAAGGQGRPMDYGL